MLELRDVSAGYGAGPVVHDVCLCVEAGQVVCLLGANGAGKSTIANTVSGLLPITSGSIRLNGQSIEADQPAGRIRAGITHVPEGRQIFPDLSVREHLELGAYAQGRALGKVALEERIKQVCRPFPALLARLDTAAGLLSGGQQQMLAIARGLMAQPRLMVLDEPSLGLSPQLVGQIFALVRALRNQGIAVLLSEQNARLSLAIADYAYVLEGGRVVLEGPATDLAGDPQVAERYLGVGKAVDALSEQRQARMTAELQQIIG